MESLKSRAELILDYERQERVPSAAHETLPYLHVLLPKHDVEQSESMKLQLHGQDAKLETLEAKMDDKLEVLEAKMDAIQESMQAMLAGLHAHGRYR